MQKPQLENPTGEKSKIVQHLKAPIERNRCEKFHQCRFDFALCMESGTVREAYRKTVL